MDSVSGLYRSDLNHKADLARSAYRPSIDGLRALAIMSVVLYHIGVPGVENGYLGVDFFFVISGYLITGILWRELESTGKLNVIGFYERRVRRLLPALLLVLAVTLVLGALFLVPVGGEQQGLAKSALATVGIVSNFYFLLTTGGYFDQPSEYLPLLHTWSLSVEEQFYLVWPLLLIFLHRLGGGSNRIFVAGLLVVVAVSFILWFWLYRWWEDAAFFLTSSRAWQLGVGGVAWHLGRRLFTGAAVAPGLGLLGLTFALGAFLAIPSSLASIGHISVVVGGALLLVVCDHAPESKIGRWLAWDPAVWIGKRSYAIYLWHWPLLAIATAHTLGELTPYQAAAICLFSVLLAHLSYTWIENPIRTKQWKLMVGSRRAFGYGLLAAVVVVISAAALGYTAKNSLLPGGSSSVVATAINDTRRIDVPCGQLRPYSGRLNPNSECRFGTGPVRLVSWGDSHAAHLLPLLEEFGESINGSVLMRYMPECPPVLDFTPTHSMIARNSGCATFNADVLDDIRQMRKEAGPLAVVLNARWSGYEDELGGGFSQVLSKTLRALSETGVRAVVVAPSVNLPHRAPQCLARRPVEECSTTREAVQKNRAQLLSQMNETVNNAPGTRLFDPVDFLCSGRSCSPISEGIVLYSDAHHWSEAAARKLLDVARPTLSWAVAPRV